MDQNFQSASKPFLFWVAIAVIALIIIGGFFWWFRGKKEELPPAAQKEKPCIISGCNNEVCGEESVSTACVFKPEFECYQKFGVCARQADTLCGWTMNEELKKCLEEKTKPGEEEIFDKG